MQILSGRRLGRYEIIAPIGAGGMGEIYRAIDTRLDRPVAIKILPSHLSTDEGRRQRFEREARTISSLSHPNICSLFDVGREDDVDFLVMELLEGETLADRISRGPLPAEQVLRYGIEIASALDRAHRQRIIHRDLKPANVMLTRSGAKLLDFGLARIALAPAEEPSVRSEGATEHRPLTEEGAILGTVQYMAPEQLEGKEADARTDIFALGAILYEMMTGKRPFAGSSRASVIAAILERQPQPVSEIQPLTPPALERVIRTCLAKDPEERWQSAHDVAAELKWISEGGSQPAIAIPGVEVRRKRTVHRIAWGALGVVAGALVTAAAWTFAPDRTDRHVMRFDVSTPPAAPMLVSRYTNLAISRNGRMLTYVGSHDEKTQLYLRRFDRLGATPIAGTEGARAPFFSPDGKWIAFTDRYGRGSLRKVSVDGGTPVTIIAEEAVLGQWWNDDGSILFVRQFSEGIWKVSPGGKAELIVRPATTMGDRALVHPQSIAGGRFILATAWTGSSYDEARIVAYPTGKGERKVIIEGGAYGRIVSSGHLVFVRGGALVAVPFDAKRLEAKGTPVPVVDDVNAGIANGEAYFSEASNGTLVYAPGVLSSPPRQLVWVDRNGNEELAVATPRQYANPSISPDGRTVAVGIQEAKFDIWTIDLERDVASRLSFGEDDGEPYFSPDGIRVVYTSSRDGSIDLYIRSADGSGPETRTTNSKEAAVSPRDWVSNDRILYTSKGKNGSDVFMTPAKPGGAPVPVLNSPFQEADARVSPDGKWLLYTSDESGRTEIYLQAFPSAGGKTQVSVGGGGNPIWSRSGREIFYVNDDRKRLMIVDVQTSPSVRVSRPRVLLNNDSYTFENGYTISRDDRRLLVVKMDRSQQLARNMVLVVNWDEELRRRVPSGR